MEYENAQPNNPTGFFGKHPSLKIKEFQSYLILRLGIIFALNMQSTTIYFWIYQMTNDKLSLGLVGLAEVIPAICCSFFSGHVVDQNEKRKMVAICLLGYIIVGIALFLLALPTAQQTLQDAWFLHLIYFFVFLGGVLRAFYSPSMFSLFGLVVPRTHYANATSWSSMAWQMGSVLGPLAAGFFIAILGVASSLFAVIGIKLLMHTFMNVFFVFYCQ